MADINGTSGNDVIQPYGSSLVLAVSGSSAEGVLPNMNVLINGVAVLSNVTVTASHAAGQTQLVNVPIAPGTTVTNVTLEYTNDTQTSWASEARNLYLSSVALNGHPLSVTSAVYHRTGGTVSVDGLAGIDTVMLDTSARSAYTVTKTSTGYTASEVGGSKVVTMANVERLDFQDINLALDMTGHAGTVAKLISAIFGASYLGVEQYVGLGLQMIDGGTSEVAAADLAINTVLFTSLAGSTSNTDFVELVYQNVVGHAPSAGELSQYVGMLDSGAQTKASLAVMAAESSHNAVHLVGVMDTGIEFV